MTMNTAPRPYLLPPNVIEHFYRGGERIAALRGHPAPSASDGPLRRPEEWLGSTVERWGTDGSGLTELGALGPLQELIAADPQTWLGAAHVARWGSSPALLVKLLDAGERLPVHVHPDRRFARTHLDCPFGKTEAWVVLDVPTGGGTAFVGTTRPVRREEWAELVDDQAVDTMIELLRPLRIDVGDGVLVPASTPHCLDAGVFVVELQEPTDFSILLEWDGFDVDGPADGHLGLGFTTALDAVRTDALDTAAVDGLVRRAALPHAEAHPLLPLAADPYFRAWAVEAAGRTRHRAGRVLDRGCHQRRRHPALGRRQLGARQRRRPRGAPRDRSADIRRRRRWYLRRRCPATGARCSRTCRGSCAVSRDLLVGIDVGTTRVKVVVVDLAGVEVAAAAVDTPWVVDGHAVEMDANVLVDAVRTVIVGGLEQCGGGDRVVGLGVTGIAESGVLLDRHGEPAAPIIAWHDQRGDVELIAKELPDLVARTGVRFDPLATIFKLPELLRRGAGVRWLNVAEWVVHSLGGAQQAEMSLSGRTGLCDLHTATWWPDALEFLGVDRSFLPGDPVFGVAGAGSASFTPIAGAHLVVAGHDHQVAAYVAGAVEPGCLFESLGTADAIAITVPAPVGAATVLATADIGATIGRTVVADRLMAMMGVRTGQILERISRLLDVGDRAARRALSERAIERAPDPDLAVELADGMVTIRGIGDDTDGAALWAAAVAATGTRTAEVIEQYAALYGPPTDVVVGGGWLNDPTIAAAVRRRFPTARRSRFGEPGAVGAACLAGISAGILDGPFAAAPCTRRKLMTMSIATTPVLEARGWSRRSARSTRCRAPTSSSTPEL